MSGNIQAPPSASMTVASGAAGVFPTTFGYYPAEGSRCVPAQYNWASQNGYVEDLSNLAARGVETTIQSVFVDNTNTPQVLTIVVLGTDQVIQVPPSSQGMFPLFFTGAPSFQISVPNTGNTVTRLYLLNVPGGGPGVWATATPGQSQAMNTYPGAPSELLSGGTTGGLTDAYGSLLVDTEAQAPTYSAAFAFTPAAAATDIFYFEGASSKTIRVHQLTLSFAATAAIGTLAFTVWKRSTNNTGGTIGGTFGGVAHDSNQAGAQAAGQWYTANPSGLGTASLPLEMLTVTSGSGLSTGPVVFNWGQYDLSVVLRGTTQILTVNLEGQSLPAGLTVRAKIKWSEI